MIFVPFNIDTSLFVTAEVGFCLVCFLGLFVFFLELEDFTLLSNTGVLLDASHLPARKASDRDLAMVCRM